MKNIIILLLIPLLSIGQTDTGWKDPTVSGNYTNMFTNRTNAYSSNDSYATYANLTGTGRESYEEFGISIPAGATINGIEVQLEHKISSAGSTIRTIQLFNVSALAGDYTAPKTFAELTTEGYNSVGGAADLWGTTWIPSDFNDGDPGYFHLVISVKTASGTRTFYLDHIQVKVYYTEAGAAQKNIFMGINF